MKKIKSLIRYEFIDLKRSPLFLIMGILYIFAVQQIISGMFSYGNTFLNLIGFQKASWLPLNFLMIPIFFIGFKVGKSENDIFKSMNVSFKEIVTSKILITLTIDMFIFFINVAVFIIIGLICKISFPYFMSNINVYIINTIMLLLVCSSIGLLIGTVINKYIGEVISYILLIGIFLILCNFYKEPKGWLPLIYCNVIASNFYVNGYEQIYLYHNIFWAFIGVGSIIIILIEGFMKEKKKKLSLLFGLMFSICIVTSGYTFTKVNQLKPVYYNIYSREQPDNNKNDSECRTYFSNESCGYHVGKYSMDINLGDKISSNCHMTVIINKDNIDSLEFGLYKKLDISKIQANGVKLDYRRTNNSFIVKLDRMYKKGEVVNLEVSYSGEINTTCSQSNDLFHVGNKRVFLGDVFEWYPKQNDNIEKKYDVKISYNGKYNMFSNLNGTRQNNVYRVSGKDKELMIISGEIKEIKYKNITFIGNEEYLNNKEYCDSLIDVFKRISNKNVDKIILGPLVPGITKMADNYENAFFYTGD